MKPKWSLNKPVLKSHPFLLKEMGLSLISYLCFVVKLIYPVGIVLHTVSQTLSCCAPKMEMNKATKIWSDVLEAVTVTFLVKGKKHGSKAVNIT